MERASGILLHPTSLPGAYGCGDLGSKAREWVDFLAAAQQTYWQVLPLCPPGFGNSPYQCFSAQAGNPILISLESLAAEGWLKQNELTACPRGTGTAARVDFQATAAYRLALLRKAFERFLSQARPNFTDELELFIEKNRDWLKDYALFMALKEVQGGRPWNEWPAAWRRPKPEDLDKLRRECAHAIAFHQFTQWMFANQWLELRAYAQEQGILIIGDAPIFVSYDSADVWAHPHLFQLKESGVPVGVAGVPPDYFSNTGQLWGNPLYQWEVMAQDGFAWWTRRLEKNLELVDLIRLDHFRGFEKYWWIPAEAETAEPGHWEEGPGAPFFEAIGHKLGGLPIIAEDLGVITPEVNDLRDRFALPGMRVLQFAFGGDPRPHPYLPHNYVKNCAVYTGTHDNDTTYGWFHDYNPDTSTMPKREYERLRKQALTYLGTDGSQIHWDLIRVAMASPADLAVIPMQDILGLGSGARMNTPGTVGPHNWSWRMKANQLTDKVTERLAALLKVCGRDRLPNTQV